MELRAFAQATEEPDLVREALEHFLPGDTEVETEEAEGHYGNPVRVLTVRLENADEIRFFLDRVGDLRERVLNQLGRRLDDDCNLWMRFDKAAALRGETRLTRSDGVVARIKVAAYPANRENAEESARELLRD